MCRDTVVLSGQQGRRGVSTRVTLDSGASQIAAPSQFRRFQHPAALVWLRRVRLLSLSLLPSACLQVHLPNENHDSATSASTMPPGSSGGQSIDDGGYLAQHSSNRLRRPCGLERVERTA